MDSREDLSRILKDGTKEEIGKAIISLSRLKDPASIKALKEVMNSDDPYISVMAAYALGEAGDMKGFEFFEKYFQNISDIPSPFKETVDINTLEEVLKLPGEINNTLDLYNSSYFVEAKEKLLKVLNLYSSSLPEMNVPHFDELVAYSVRKTKGLLLNALSICELHLGNMEQALQYSLEAMTIAEEVGDPQLLKIAHADLGHIHMYLGNYYQALELIHKSLEIDEQSHDPWRKKNRTLSVLSQLYYCVGHYEKALEYVQEAIDLSDKENDIYGKARCLNTKGVILCYLNEFKEAEGFLFEAFRLARDELKDKTLQGLILTNLSDVYGSLSETGKAKEYLEKALVLAEQMSDKSLEGNILANMAVFEVEDGSIEKAKACAVKALDIGNQTYDRSGQADAEYILGSIEDYYLDNPDTAYKHYKESISIYETLRKNLVIDEFKLSFAEKCMNAYQQMVSLCVHMGKKEDAFIYAEKAKSRALVDMLSHAVNDISSQKVSNDILDEIGILQGELDFLRKKLNSAYMGLPDETANNSRQPEVESVLLDEITTLELKYIETLDELKMKDPERASLISADVIDLKTVQNMLDEKTLILEFYQTNNELIFLLIGRYESPSIYRINIDVEKDSEKLYSLLFALSEGRGIDTRSHEYIKNIKQPLAYFYQLLIAPIVEELCNINNLIIIPHYFWHYLPFHALYDKLANEFLIDKFSISYAPSASALYYCINKDSKQYKSAVIFANPSNDLPFAEEEAEKVRARFSNNVHLFKGENASINKLYEHSHSDIIHLACHGYYRGDEPLFSYLVLAGENPEESSYYLPDLFNLKLQTSLVTLSACETGLSEFTIGDELIGISRAFFYAGTPSLLASHWTINDKSTSLFMDKFYEGLIDKGKTKAMALKYAVQELKALPEYGHPYFWAPFFLSGDWR